MTTTTEEKPKRSTRRRGNGEGSIFQRADGRWCAIFNDGYDRDGKRHRKHVYRATKREVQEELTRLQSRKLDGTLTESRRLTVAKFLTQWLESSVKPTVRVTTFDSYKRAVEKHINPILGGLQLAKLAPAAVQAMVGKLEANGKGTDTRRIARIVLHRACKQALRWGMIPRNPVDAVEAPRVARREMHVWTTEQAQAFLGAAKGDRLEALYVVALDSGMRLGELLGLQWAAIDLQADNPYLMVKSTLQEVGGILALAEPKTSKSRRRIALSRVAIDALWDHKRRALAAGQADGFVFRDSRGGPLRRSHFHANQFKPLLKRAKVPAIRFHDLRHTMGSAWLAANVHPKVVQERLGHSTISVTMDIYSHVLPTMHQEAADHMGKLLAGVAG
jgi:integrase